MQRSALCRSRRELSSAYLLAKIGVDDDDDDGDGQGTFNELLYKSIIKHSLPRRGISSSLSRNKIGLDRVVAA